MSPGAFRGDGTEARAEEDIMCGRIAIATEHGTGKQSVVDPRFGRAAGFLVIDVGSGEVVEQLDNRDSLPGYYPGPNAVLKLNRLKVGAVISSRLGVKSGAQLESLAMEAWIAPDGITAEEALERFKAGTLVRRQAIFL
jgi:predicted Fe-Mo cluster-binding NifX family protein